MERAYPTRNEVPISTRELELRPSSLDPEDPRNWNNHHLYYNKGLYLGGHSLILCTLRNMEGSQEMMLRDQHMRELSRFALHSIYGPFEPPSFGTALDVIESGIMLGEQQKIYDPDQRGYIRVPVTDIHWKQLLMEYNDLRERGET